MLQIQHRVRKYLGECINLKVGQRRKECSGQTRLKQNADKPDSECLHKRTAQWYRQEPDFPEFAIYLFTTTCRKKHHYLIQVIRENNMVTSVFICQALEYNKLLKVFPEKLKVDIDCLILGGVL